MSDKRQFTLEFIQAFYAGGRKRHEALKHQRKIRKLMAKAELPRESPLNSWWVLNQSHRKARHFEVKEGETFDQAWERFMAPMPRKPWKFLAMVAENDRKARVAELVRAKRDKGRAKYLKMMKR